MGTFDILLTFVFVNICFYFVVCSIWEWKLRIKANLLEFCLSFMNVLIEDNKKYIATYPIFLFYLFIDWFTLLI
jgi:hypothetical protein